MTPQQRQFARMALGLPNPRNTPARNRLVLCPGTSEWDEFNRMALMGFAHKFSDTDRETIFALTLEGARASIDQGEHLDPEDFAEARDGAEARH
jgi:hypothetical protein